MSRLDVKTVQSASDADFFSLFAVFANIKLNGQRSTESLPAHLWNSRKDDSLNGDASALSPRSKGIVKNISNASSVIVCSCGDRLVRFVWKHKFGRSASWKETVCSSFKLQIQCHEV